MFHLGLRKGFADQWPVLFCLWSESGKDAVLQWVAECETMVWCPVAYVYRVMPLSRANLQTAVRCGLGSQHSRRQLYCRLISAPTCDWYAIWKTAMQYTIPGVNTKNNSHSHFCKMNGCSIFVLNADPPNLITEYHVSIKECVVQIF